MEWPLNILIQPINTEHNLLFFVFIFVHATKTPNTHRHGGARYSWEDPVAVESVRHSHIFRISFIDILLLTPSFFWGSHRSFLREKWWQSALNWYETVRCYRDIHTDFSYLSDDTNIFILATSNESKGISWELLWNIRQQSLPSWHSFWVDHLLIHIYMYIQIRYRSSLNFIFYFYLFFNMMKTQFEVNEVRGWRRRVLNVRRVDSVCSLLANLLPSCFIRFIVRWLLSCHSLPPPRRTHHLLLSLLYLLVYEKWFPFFGYQISGWPRSHHLTTTLKPALVWPSSTFLAKCCSL